MVNEQSGLPEDLKKSTLPIKSLLLAPTAQLSRLARRLTMRAGSRHITSTGLKRERSKVVVPDLRAGVRPSNLYEVLADVTRDTV